MTDDRADPMAWDALADAAPERAIVLHRAARLDRAARLHERRSHVL
jgi:hypothetical protein